MIHNLFTWPLRSGLRMLVCAACAAVVAEKYALGVFSPTLLAAVASLLALLIGASALRQMRKADVSAVQKFAGLVVAAVVCTLIGVRVWPVLGPGASQAFAQVPALLRTEKSPDKAKDAADGTSKDKAKEKEPTASAPVQPKPVLDAAALQARCSTWGNKAPRFARELIVPDGKNEPEWVTEARELDHEVTRSFEALKVKVDEKVRTSFATLSDKDKEYVDVILKSWSRYQDGEYRPPFYDLNGLIVQISSPHFDNSGVSYLVSVISTRIKSLEKLKAELSIVPGFSL